MEGRQNLAGLLSLSVVPAGCLPSCQGAVCLSWMQKSCQGCQWCRVPSSSLSGCRVPLMDAKELPGLPVVPCLPSCQGAVCLSWMQKSCQGCQWCRVPSSILSGCRVCSHGCKRAARGCRRVPTASRTGRAATQNSLIL